MGPGGLADAGPDEGFLDVCGGSVVTGEEAYGGGVGGGGAAEELGEDGLDAVFWGWDEICRVGGWTFVSVWV